RDIVPIVRGVCDVGAISGEDPKIERARDAVCSHADVVGVRGGGDDASRGEQILANAHEAQPLVCVRSHASALATNCLRFLAPTVAARARSWGCSMDCCRCRAARRRRSRRPEEADAAGLTDTATAAHRLLAVLVHDTVVLPPEAALRATASNVPTD